MDGSALRVLYCSSAYTTHDRRFLESLAAAGCILFHLPLGPERLELQAPPSNVVSLAPPKRGAPNGFLGWLGCAGRIRQTLIQIAPHVVLAGPIPHAAFWVAASGYRPLIAMSWGSDLLGSVARRPWRKLLARYALRRAAGFFGDCEAVRQEARALAPFEASNLVVFPWGVDSRHFSPGPPASNWRAARGWSDDPVLLSLRSWEPVYAIDVLLRALARLRLSQPRVRLLMVGGGSQANRLEALIDALDLRASVHLPGRVSQAELPDYLRSADLYVSSAKSDGTSVSLLEAMACGLPVVATRHAGNAEWIEEGRSGWLATPGSVPGLAAALEAALAHRADWPRIAAENRATVLRRADWNRNFPQLVGLLRRVAKRPQPESVPAWAPNSVFLA